MAGNVTAARWEEAAALYAATAETAGLKTAAWRFACGRCAHSLSAGGDAVGADRGRVPGAAGAAAGGPVPDGAAQLLPVGAEGRPGAPRPDSRIVEAAAGDARTADVGGGDRAVRAGAACRRVPGDAVDLLVRLVRLFPVQLTVPPFQLTWEQYRAHLDAVPVQVSTRNT